MKSKDLKIWKIIQKEVYSLTFSNALQFVQVIHVSQYMFKLMTVNISWTGNNVHSCLQTFMSPLTE